MSIDLSILIPTHNRCDILSQTLDSLQSLHVPDGQSIELVVVANACSDDTEQVVDEKAKTLPFPVDCVREAEAGLSRARNCAIHHAQGEILAFLDDDVWVEEEWLARLLDVYSTEPADVVGGRVDLWWEAVKRPAWMTDRMVRLLSGTHLTGESPIELDLPFGLIGANFSFRRRVHEQLGDFRVDLGRTGQSLGSAEECEFFARALKKGFRIFYTPFAGVKHWVAPARADIGYLSAIARGNSRSRVLMRNAFGPRQALRTIVGNLYLILRHTPAEWFHTLRRDRRRRYDHRLWRMNGGGGLAGVWQRLRKTD